MNVSLEQTATRLASQTVVDGSQPRADGNAPGRPLNAMDCTMLAVDAAVRADGSSGFNTQALIWLGGRIDAGRLQAAIQRFAQAYPVIGGCLHRQQRRGEPSWKARPAESCKLHEATLPAAERMAVLEHAAGLLSAPFDPFSDPPLAFHLLHRSDGRDVLLVQFSHILMDNPAIIPLLQRLQKSSHKEPPGDLSRQADGRDALAEYLARHSRGTRLRAAWQTAYLRLRSLRNDIALFGNTSRGHHSPQPLGFLSRELDREQTRSLAANVARACGFPGLSMALLASVFRAGQQTGLAQPAGARLTTGIGLDLGLRGAGEPLFDNLSSVVPIVAQSDQLLCRRELTQALNAQLRDRLQRRIDLGVIALSDLFRHRRGIVGYAMSRLMRGGYSVWYAYFGSGDAIGDAFFDVPIEDFTSFGPCWPSIGLTVIASEFRQRMQLQCTYVAGGVSHLAAETFMDALVYDLHGWEREDG